MSSEDTARDIPALVLHPGSATGPVLILTEPLSFWGGVSAAGTIIDRHHPQLGTCVTGRVVAMPAGRGSSSSSSVLAEQIRAGTAPAAILLTQPDTIIVLGAAVAAELYGLSLPILQVTPADCATLSDGDQACIESDGGPGTLETVVTVCRGARRDSVR